MLKFNRLIFLTWLAVTALCVCQRGKAQFVDMAEALSGASKTAQHHARVAFIKAAGTQSALPASTATTDAPTGYVLVWSDEFSVNGLPDASKWTYDTEANATGWFNNELQYYSIARKTNSEVREGELTITARKESLSASPDYGGQAYSSARLITRGKASWTYGFFEIRAKLPCGLGTWPAIWMLGTKKVGWPVNGEIDIMEQTGSRPTKILGTIHTGATVGKPGVGGWREIMDACVNFHNYQMTWTADKITISVDNKPYFIYKNPKTGTNTWPFDDPQYLILNLAIGGDFGGKVDDSIFPAQLKIEHVRIYQKH